MSTVRVAATPSLRLTRRGRLVVFLGSLGITLTALFAWVPSVVATSEEGDPIPVRVVTVEPGDTLWDIASRANPGGNVGDTVHDIADLNALASTGDLQVGQQLSVPRY
ncbi:MAG TPA: LysM peptidoglycan-binding domain-containing protein [Nocardioidaceae bacterium]|jgi:LysM repeat protein|nr:LysM peptidoglycan-binding domain-containing protein [Nocardioidaceae bacterium]